MEIAAVSVFSAIRRSKRSAQREEAISVGKTKRELGLFIFSSNTASTGFM